MPTRKLNKPAEGKKMPLTPDMIAWKKEFDEMDLEAHKAKLKALGLDDDELAEFEEMEEGAPVEDELIQEDSSEKDSKKKKKTTKKK